MLYVVVGHPRTGTSMLMQGLEAGGMQVAYSKERDLNMQARFEQASGFNPGGLYELPRTKLASEHFPARYDGMVVKLVWEWLRYMHAYAPGYHVILTWREPEEVRQSYEGTILQHRVKKTKVAVQYEQRWDVIRQGLIKREDVRSLITVSYNAMIAQPTQQWERLKQHGWPIDPEAAAGVVNPDLYRFRLDDTIIRGA